MMDFISLGMNLDTYYSMKKSGNLPRADEAVAMADSLEVSVEYLVTGERGENREAVLRVQDLACRIIKEIDRVR
jgi:hypothetical protein